MKVKELIKLMGFVNRNCDVKINGCDIKVSYSVNQNGEWEMNIDLVNETVNKSPQNNNNCGEKQAQND